MKYVDIPCLVTIVKVLHQNLQIEKIAKNSFKHNNIDIFRMCCIFYHCFSIYVHIIKFWEIYASV